MRLDQNLLEYLPITKKGMGTFFSDVIGNNNGNTITRTYVGASLGTCLGINYYCNSQNCIGIGIHQFP
jgi:hypothetical protein